MGHYRQTQPARLIVDRLGEPERAFLLRRRVGHLATASEAAEPSVVPVCFALGEDCLYTAIDEKPKHGPRLRRLTNLAKNDKVAFVADCYAEDWSQLGWVMIGGRAEILDEGAEFQNAVALLQRRYAQYSGMRLTPVIVIRIDRVRVWGNLDH